MFNANRLVRQFATMLAATALISTIAACPPPATNPDPNLGAEKPPPPPESEDIAINDLEEVKQAGALFQPEGFGMPGMLKMTVKRKTTLDKQRKTFKKAKPNKKSIEAKILVSMLWNAGSAAVANSGNKDAAKPFREEARDKLREAVAALGDQADAVLMRMLFTAEMWTGEKDAAVQVGEALMARHPDTKSGKAIAPWIAYFKLRQWKTAEAAAITQGWTLADQDMTYLRAYVMAWTAFRQRNNDAARDAMVYAANTWKSRGTRPVMERDLQLILTRTGTPIDQAIQAILALPTNTTSPKDDAYIKYIRLYKLYEGYEAVGSPALAAQALAKALEVFGPDVPGPERIVILLRQSNGYLIDHQPDKAADIMLAAYAAVAPCADACAGKDEEVAGQIATLSTHLHNIYATTLDEAYFAPAKKLYDFYVTKNHKDKANIQSYLTRLQETKQTAVAGSGKHDSKILDWSTKVRNKVVLACYESVLQGEPQLKGSLKLTLNIDDTGKVTGAETDPAAGEAGMAAVAGCVAERARGWVFPGRTKKGNTAVVRTYLVEPPAPAAPAAAPTP